MVLGWGRTGPVRGPPGARQGALPISFDRDKDRQVQCRGEAGTWQAAQEEDDEEEEAAGGVGDAVHSSLLERSRGAARRGCGTRGGTTSTGRGWRRGGGAARIRAMDGIPGEVAVSGNQRRVNAAVTAAASSSRTEVGAGLGMMQRTGRAGGDRLGGLRWGGAATWSQGRGRGAGTRRTWQRQRRTERGRGAPVTRGKAREARVGRDGVCLLACSGEAGRRPGSIGRLPWCWSPVQVQRDEGLGREICRDEGTEKEGCEDLA